MPRFNSVSDLCTACAAIVAEGDGVPMYQVEAPELLPAKLRFVCEHIRRARKEEARATAAAGTESITFTLAPALQEMLGTDDSTLYKGIEHQTGNVFTAPADTVGHIVTDLQDHADPNGLGHYSDAAERRLARDAAKRIAKRLEVR